MAASWNREGIANDCQHLVQLLPGSVKGRATGPEDAKAILRQTLPAPTLSRQEERMPDRSMITDPDTYFAKGCGRCDRFATPDCSTRFCLRSVGSPVRLALPRRRNGATPATCMPAATSP